MKLSCLLAPLCLLMSCGDPAVEPVDAAADDSALDSTVDSGDSAICGDERCDRADGETCSTCAPDCGTCPPPSGEVDWFCDWDLGTGASEARVRGNNGSSAGGGDPSVLTYWYWGGLAVRISDDPDDWIAAYPTGAEIN